MKNAPAQARSHIKDALERAGLNPRTTPPMNAYDEYVFIGEGAPFVEISTNAYGVDVHFELLAFPKATLDPEKQVERADQLTGRVLEAIWETSEIECSGYSTITSGDDKPRTVARFNATVTIQ